MALARTGRGGSLAIGYVEGRGARSTTLQAGQNVSGAMPQENLVVCLPLLRNLIRLNKGYFQENLLRTNRATASLWPFTLKLIGLPKMFGEMFEDDD